MLQDSYQHKTRTTLGVQVSDKVIQQFFKPFGAISANAL
jgi:hypothetical protein